MRLTALLLTVALLGCGPDEPPDPVPDASSSSPDAGVDLSVDGDDAATCERTVELTTSDVQEVTAQRDCTVSVALDSEAIVEVVATDAVLAGGGEPDWIAPHLSDELALEVSGTEPWSVTIHAHGEPVGEVARDRSLVWTDPALVEDPDVVGLRRLMEVAAGHGDPGTLLAHWLRRFGTTAHSERLGTQQLLEEFEDTHGDDPTTWDLDALDFVVTAVHNRVDLADGESCGELRVSVASSHPLYQPFHAIFLFEQVPGELDVSPGGEVHCGATHRRWARLSELTPEEFRMTARELLDEGLTAERFLMIETVEFVVSPWEWRQWVPRPNPDATPLLPRVLENPPLFQTVDTARLNEPGPLREDFLSFVEDNAAALDAREMEFPERFRPQSARVNAGVPWVPLSLDGIDTALLAERPNLRQNIEITGCPACHATDAEFVQTRPDRTFSPFYDKELDARAEYLDGAHRGVAPEVPFGPLQPDPVLPP